MTKPARAARRTPQGASTTTAEAPARRACVEPRRAATKAGWRPSKLMAGIGVSALALAGTIGFSLAAVPQATAHDAPPSVGPRTDAAAAVSRTTQDRAAGAVDRDADSQAEADALFAARQAALAQVNQGTRDGAVGAFVQLWTQQENARYKNGGATPKNATPTDGFTTLLQPTGTDTSQYRLPLDPGTYTLSANFGATGLWAPYHTGQDFAAPAGTPAYAVADAIVGPGITDDWAGNHVVLHLPDGGTMLYAHLTDTLVKPGQIVHAGDMIGHVGNTGRSFGAHLHLQYCPNGVYVGDNNAATNPLDYLHAHGVKD